MLKIHQGSRVAAWLLALLSWMATPGAVAQDAATASAAPAVGVKEAWEAIYIGAEKIGHNHFRVEPITDRRGNAYLRVQVNTVLSFKRGKDRADMEVRYGTIETSDGQVLRLDTQTKVGQEEIRTHGDVVDGVMTLILDAGGQQRQQEIAWGEDVRGPYAAELSLSRDPIEPAEKRVLKMYVPTLNQVVTTHLAAIGIEPVTLGGGVKRDLMRVEQTIQDSAGKAMPELDTTLWADTNGQILKSRAAMLGGTDSYRTTEAGAMAPNGQFDLLAATIFKVSRAISQSQQSRTAQYRLRLSGGDLAEIFPSDQRQTLVVSEPGQGTLTVTTASRGQPALAATATSEYLAANPIINSDDAGVIAHMRQATAGQSDPWGKAQAIQDWVFRNVKKKDFSKAFAGAREVARTLEGDCTEHAVLTAAMCRAAGIPSRMVVGLVYATPFTGFGPHAWNEVLINGQWMAIDSAFNQSFVDATHLKVAASSMDGVAPFETFMPIIRIMDRLTIEPLDVR